MALGLHIAWRFRVGALRKKWEDASAKRHSWDIGEVIGKHDDNVFRQAVALWGTLFPGGQGAASAAVPPKRERPEPATSRQPQAEAGREPKRPRKGKEATWQVC